MGGAERGGAGYSAALVYAKQIQRLTQPHYGVRPGLLSSIGDNLPYSLRVYANLIN